LLISCCFSGFLFTEAPVVSPQDLQELCEKLQSSNMAEIAREMGVPRSTLYGKLTKLRDAFREAGLEEYL
jgi:RNA polymerase sigma-70 factor (ECF subfamily)